MHATACVFQASELEDLPQGFLGIVLASKLEVQAPWVHLRERIDQCQGCNYIRANYNNFRARNITLYHNFEIIWVIQKSNKIITFNFAPYFYLYFHLYVILIYHP